MLAKKYLDRGARIPALQRVPTRPGIRKLPILSGSAACTVGAGRVAGAIGTRFFGSAEIGPVAERVFSLQMGGHGKRVVGNPSSHSD